MRRDGTKIGRMRVEFLRRCFVLEILAWCGLLVACYYVGVLHQPRLERAVLFLGLLAFPPVAATVAEYATRDRAVTIAAAVWPFVLFFLVKKEYWGLRVVSAFGFVLNSAVIIANGGWMPVLNGSPKSDFIHGALTKETRLSWLADQWGGRWAVIWGGNFSIGDVLIYGGLVFLGYQVFRKRFRR